MTLLDDMNERARLPWSRFSCLALLFGLPVVFSCPLVHAENTKAAGELSRAPANSFSIVVIPDTQHYRGRGTKGAAETRKAR